MIKLSACIEMLFSEHTSFVERIALAKAAGFDAYEFWNYQNKDIPALVDAMQAADLPCAGCCVGTLDAARAATYADGNMLKRKNASVYAEMVEESIEATKPLGVTTLIATTGQALLDISRGAQQDAVIECLKAAAPIAQKHGVTIVLEPLNTLVNHAGYFLPTSAHAMEILKAVDNTHVRMLYDIYHQQITEGFLIPTITHIIDHIGHFHLADVPGRIEPGTGEINYANVLKVISDLGYDRYVGCEYTPSNGKTTEQSAEHILAIRNSINA